MQDPTEPRLLHEISAPGFQIEQIEVPAGFRLEGHGHANAHICIVTEGAFREGDQVMSSGWSRVSPPGDTHRIEFLNTGATCLVLELDPALIDGAPYPHDRRFAHHPSVPVVARQLSRALGAPATVATIELVTLELVARACLMPPMHKHGQPPVWLERIRAALNDSPLEPPSTESLAAEAGLHPVYVARLFRTWYGCSLSDYARLLRLDCAVRMIAESSESLAAVAACTGYADQSHLTRAVRRRTGLTPRALRSGKVASVPDFRMRRG